MNWVEQKIDMFKEFHLFSSPYSGKKPLHLKNSFTGVRVQNCIWWNLDCTDCNNEIKDVLRLVDIFQLRPTPFFVAKYIVLLTSKDVLSCSLVMLFIWWFFVGIILCKILAHRHKVINLRMNDICRKRFNIENILKL